MSAAALQTVTLVTQELQTQTLNSIVGGFSFAAAMSWMDFVRWTITQVIKGSQERWRSVRSHALLTSSFPSWSTLRSLALTVRSLSPRNPSTR